MTYKELVRLATEPGPMQELAMQALMQEFEADTRSENMRGRNDQFDIARFAPEYIDAKLARPRIPRGDMSQEYEDRATQEDAVNELLRMYDRQYPESLGDRAKGALTSAGGALSQFGDYVTSPEGVLDTATMLRDSFGPGYSQYDSLKFADENMDKFVNHAKYGIDPLTALQYLPNAAIGYIGSVPGAAAIVSGARKLGGGTKALYEGLF